VVSAAFVVRDVEGQRVLQEAGVLDVSWVDDDIRAFARCSPFAIASSNAQRSPKYPNDPHGRVSTVPATNALDDCLLGLLGGAWMPSLCTVSFMRLSSCTSSRF